MQIICKRCGIIYDGHSKYTPCDKCRGEIAIKVRGENHPLAKLTADDVRAIRQKYSKGVKIIDISKMFHVHYSAIQQIINHKTWKHVKDVQ